MKSLLKTTLPLVVLAASSVASAAVDPAFTTQMTAMAADVIAYFIAAVGACVGVFALATGVRIFFSTVRKVAK